MAVSRRAPRPLTDQGAALERTALAWERTAFSLGAIGALLIKIAGVGGATRAAGVCLLAAAAAVLLLVVPLGYRRAQRHLRPVTDEQSLLDPDRWRAAGLIGVTVLVTATAAAIAVDLTLLQR